MMHSSKKVWHGGERVKKVGKTSDVIYGWPKPHPPPDYFDHYTMGYNSFWCVIPFSTHLCIYGFDEIFPSFLIFYDVWSYECLENENST